MLNMSMRGKIQVEDTSFWHKLMSEYEKTRQKMEEKFIDNNLTIKSSGT